MNLVLFLKEGCLHLIYISEDHIYEHEILNIYMSGYNTP
jgi:hypothetical protein